MDSTLAFNQHTTAGHALFLYASEAERLKLLANYFTQGIDSNELCVYVTHEPEGQAIQSLETAGFNATAAINGRRLEIFAMNETYLPEGKFIADFMLNNVQTFIEDAKHRGMAGLRTAGDMRWLVHHDEAIEDAVQYEHSVNTLNQPDPAFTGLCMYPVQEVFGQILTGAMHSHPTYINNQKLYANPYFKPALA